VTALGEADQAGVTPKRIAFGKPQQTDRHERMQLTLLQDTATPPARTLRNRSASSEVPMHRQRRTTSRSTQEGNPAIATVPRLAATLACYVRSTMKQIRTCGSQRQDQIPARRSTSSGRSPVRLLGLTEVDTGWTVSYKTNLARHYRPSKSTVKAAEENACGPTLRVIGRLKSAAQIGQIGDERRYAR
jgi:hypothetical protein